MNFAKLLRTPEPLWKTASCFLRSILCVNRSLSIHLFCIEVIICLPFTAYPAGIDNNDDGKKETKTLSDYQRVLEILQGNFSSYSVFVFITHFQEQFFTE